jgi:general secretion pathway protein K
MALIMVLAALTVLTVMLTEVQDESSAELGSALTARDALIAEYAGRSGVNLSRLLIAAEPTIRNGITFILGPQAPQVPVWEFADRVLGAFNDSSGAEAFLALAGVDPKLGKNLGFEGGGFEVKIIDEDSKINVNVPARGDAFSQTRLAAQLVGLIGPPQYDALFQSRDADGQFSDRQAICAAIIDWTDPDQDQNVCDPTSETAQQAGAEDSFYDMLKKPYPRKNAAFDSLEELRRVRGMGEDFWATFVEPDPDQPDKRTLTVWGQGQLNVNTANPQTVLAFVCAAAPSARVCHDANEAGKLLMALTLLRGATFGAPVFRSPKQFVDALEHKGMFGPILKALDMEPVTVLSRDVTMKAATTESKVFSIYATGYVRAGKRETRVRVHAVVDFRGAPPPGMQQPPGTAGVGGAAAAASAATGIPGALQPSTAGNIVYYRID